MSIFDMKFFKFFGYKKKPKAPWSKYYKKETNSERNTRRNYSYHGEDSL